MYRIAVTNRHLCEGDFLSRIQKLAKGKEYQAIMLREKDLSESEYEYLAKDVLEICDKYGKKCILHSFWKVACKYQHPYIHLPLSVWDSMSDLENALLKTQMFEIGTSIHSLEQLLVAKQLGATYVTAGHIYVTDCKKGVEPRGISFLQNVCKTSNIPVYGIGGINRENENQVIKAGAAGVCIMSGCMKG